MYYVRRLSNPPNYNKVKDANDIGKLEADILKQELGTTGNKLSFWRCDDLQNNRDTLKAVLLSTTGIKKTRFYCIPDEIMDKYGFSMDDSELGETGYKGFENLHSNMIDLNYSKIGTVLTMLNEVFKYPELTPELRKEEIREYIKEVINAGLLNTEAIHENLKKDIDKIPI